MLEIIILFKLCSSIGRILEEKGRKSGWFKLMLVVFWFVGEFFVAFVGMIVIMAVDNTDEPSIGLSYLLGILGAALGAFAAFAIAKSVPPVYREPITERGRDPLGEDEWSDEGNRQDRSNPIDDPQTTHSPPPDAFRSEKPR
jgi:hypothetical protein